MQRPRHAVALAFGLGLVTGGCGLIEHQPADQEAHAEGAEGDAEAKKPDRLATLGYLGATEVRKEDAAKSGVVFRDEERSQVDKVLWTSNGWGNGFHDVPGQIARRDAVLIDGEGNELHRWRGPDEFAGPPNRPNGWAQVKLGPDGSLYVVDFLTRVLKVDWDSNVYWEHPGRYHHDIDLSPEGHVWALTSVEVEIEIDGKPRWIWDDFFHLYDSDTGEELRKFSVHESLMPMEGWRERFDDAVARRVSTWGKNVGSDLDAVTKKKAVDAYHTNTVHVLQRPLDDVWEAGDLLTSFRHMNLIAVLDKDDGALKWWWIGSLDHQHDPSFLDNDHILIFDNRPNKQARSRIIEIDPRTKEIVWEFSKEKKGEFFSNIRGQVSRLDGGNTLIVDSQRGRIFEITTDGDLVWDFFSPDTFMRTPGAKQKGPKGKRGKRAKRSRRVPKGKPKLMRVPLRAKTVEGEAGRTVDAILAGTMPPPRVGEPAKPAKPAPSGGPEQPDP